MEIVSSNDKGHIKWVERGATVFLLFWLHLASQSSKIISLKLFSCWWCRKTLKLLDTLPLDIFYHLLTIITDQNMSFHRKVGRGIGEVSIWLATVCLQFVSHSNDVCYVVDCLIFTWILCSLFTKVYIPTL